MNKRFLEHLLSKGFLDELQLRGALAQHKQSGVDMTEIFLRRRMLGEADLARALASFYRYPLVDLNEETPQDKALDLVDGEFARKNGLLPLTLSPDRTKLRVAVSDPARSLEALEFIHRRSGAEPQPHVAERTALTQAVGYYYFGDLPSRRAEASESLSGLLPLPGATPIDAAVTEIGVRKGPGKHAARPSKTQPPFGAGKASTGPPPVKPSPKLDPNRGEVRRFGRGERRKESETSPEAPAALAVVEERLQGLAARVKRLEDSVTHDRRLLQTLMDVLIESGLTSRQELLDRVRKG